MINISNSNNNQMTVVLWYMHMANKPCSGMCLIVHFDSPLTNLLST